LPLVVLLWGSAGLAGCAHGPTPEAEVRAALGVEPGEGGLGDPVAGGQLAWVDRGGEVVATRGAGGWVPAEAHGRSPEAVAEEKEGAAAALRGFLGAVEAGAWAEAWGQLCSGARPRGGPGALAQDWRRAGPRGRAVLDALLAAARPARVHLQGRGARVAVSSGWEALLCFEGGEWRVGRVSPGGP